MCAHALAMFRTACVLPVGGDRRCNCFRTHMTPHASISTFTLCVCVCVCVCVRPETGRKHRVALCSRARACASHWPDGLHVWRAPSACCCFCAPQVCATRPLLRPMLSKTSVCLVYGSCVLWGSACIRLGTRARLAACACTLLWHDPHSRCVLLTATGIASGVCHLLAVSL